MYLAYSFIIQALLHLTFYFPIFTLSSSSPILQTLTSPIIYFDPVPFAHVHRLICSIVSQALCDSLDSTGFTGLLCHAIFQARTPEAGQPLLLQDLPVPRSEPGSLHTHCRQGLCQLSCQGSHALCCNHQIFALTLPLKSLP